MKNATLFFFFSLFSLTTTFSQSTEKFIRIIGNASHTFKSDVTRVYFTVNEVAPNEYKKIAYKPIESSYSEFITSLKDVGIDEKSIVKTISEVTKFNKTQTRYYYVDIRDRNTLDHLSSMQGEGYEVKEVKYLYTDLSDDIESNLSLSAIADAKRKAQNICSEIDMKLGKILNIEDKSSGCCNTIQESKEPETIKKYNITITFELLDK